MEPKGVTCNPSAMLYTQEQSIVADSMNSEHAQSTPAARQSAIGARTQTDTCRMQQAEARCMKTTPALFNCYRQKMNCHGPQRTPTEGTGELSESKIIPCGGAIECDRGEGSRRTGMCRECTASATKSVGRSTVLLNNSASPSGGGGS